MNVEQRKLADLTPYSKNAKKHDQQQIDNVAESIKQFGFVQPIVIDKDGVIVIGHCRALAAEKLKMKYVPCVVVDELTPEQINTLRIVDNKTNESPWDFDLLMEELNNINLDGFNFESLLDDGYLDSFFERGVEAKEHEIQFGCRCMFLLEEERDECVNQLRDLGYDPELL